MTDTPMKSVDGELVPLEGDELADFLARLANPPAPPVSDEISDRQFAQQLAIAGTITEAEAIAWASRGDLPTAMETAIAALPSDQRFAARMLLTSATTYRRSHPMTAALAAVLGYNATQLNALWRDAAQL